MIITYDTELVNDNTIIETLNSNTTYSCALKKEKSNSFFGV